MKEVVSNLNNSSKSKIENELKAKPVVKSAFVPPKNKIQSMEKDQEKSKIETEEFMQKHKSIMAQKLIENFDDEPKISEDSETEKNGHTPKSLNGLIDTVVAIKNGKSTSEVPPKPLPRKSISDQGSFELSESPSVVLPKPRPRTACTTYKVH